MLSQTFQVMLRNWTYYVLIVVGAIVISAIDDIRDASFSNTSMTFIWALLALCVHYAVLFDTKFADVGNNNNRNFIISSLPFFLKALALGLLGIVASLPIILIILESATVASPSADLIALPLLLCVLCMLIVYALVLAAVGTWLPASIYGAGKGFGDAFRRGKHGFLSTFGRLFSSLFLSVFISFATIIAGNMLFESAAVVVDNRPNIPFIGILAVSLLIQAMTVTYVAVVLSKAYISNQDVAPPRDRTQSLATL